MAGCRVVVESVLPDERAARHPERAEGETVHQFGEGHAGNFFEDVPEIRVSLPRISEPRARIEGQRKSLGIDTLVLQARRMRQNHPSGYLRLPIVVQLIERQV